MAKKRMKLAKPGKRFGAACIDAAIPFVLCIISMIAAPSRNTYSFDYSYNNQYSYGYHETSSGSAAVMVIVLLLLLAYVVVEFVFYAKAASIGKKIIGLQVVSSLDGKPLGFWRMLYRECIVKQASSVFMLGYIWILVDERNRGWHDKIMDTYVVDNKATALAAAGGSAPAAPAAPYTPAAPAQGMPAAPAPAAAPAAPTAAPAPTAASAPTAAPAQASAEVTFDVNVPPAAPAAPAPEAPAAPAPAPAAPAPAMPARPSIRLDIDEPAPAAVKADMSMKKDELLAAAAKLGVSVNAKATKAEIIEAINKASK